jgi:phosphonate transport system ATP-binding protein
VCLEDGLTVIASLHVLELARSFGRRIVALREGRVAYDGPAADFDARAARDLFGEAGL